MQIKRVLDATPRLDADADRTGTRVYLAVIKSPTQRHFFRPTLIYILVCNVSFSWMARHPWSLSPIDLRLRSRVPYENLSRKLLYDS